MEHKLKILPEYFEAVKSGSKSFEVRKDDRGFQAGDTLFLQEYENGEYTGAGLKVMVTYVLRDTEYCKEGYCIMGIKLKAVNSKTTIISRVFCPKKKFCEKRKVRKLIDKELCKKCIYYDDFCCRNNKAICVNNSEYRNAEMVINYLINRTEGDTE